MLRKIIFTLIAALMLNSAHAKEADDRPLVYVIPIKEMIEPALLYVVRRGVDEAARKKADAIIIEMDTPGGRVDSALAIVSTLGKSKVPVYTFVEREAISAGGLIALSTPVIYMSPGSVIGDITPISLGLTGVQELPAAEKEKMTSYVAAHVRSAAEQGGYDPKLAEAMVRADIEYKDGETIISPEGKVLTMTNTEAEQLVGEEKKPLLSKGTVSNIEEMLSKIGLENAEQKTIETTGLEKIARFVAGLAQILLLVGLGGLWLEFKTPGFGLFGILGISCLLLFFFGHHIAGLSGMEDILIFSLGIALLAIEIFVTPGFGLMGISGLILIFLALINAMIEHMPGEWTPASYSAETLAKPLMNVTLAFAGSVVLVLIAGKFLPQTKMFRGIALDAVLPDIEEETDLIGLEGVSHSDLRPSGTAYFEGRKIDVVTQGDFIPRQTEVRIIEVHGNRIVVEDCSHG